jgi:murein DD-endopeptidase MepM/ murein hydrolase activator NlpD
MRQTIPKPDFLGKGRSKDWYSDLFDIELAQSFTRYKGKRISLSAYTQQGLRQLPGREEMPLQPWRTDQQSAQGSTRRSVPALRQALNSHPTAEPAEFSNVQMGLPVVGQLTAHYGMRSDPFTTEQKAHCGIDIASPIGTPIRAALPGTVTFSGWKQGYGLTVIISHADGYTTQYSHNSENLVQVGEYINQKQPIALSGAFPKSCYLPSNPRLEGRTGHSRYDP